MICNAGAAGARVGRTLYFSPLAWRIGAAAAPFVALFAGITADLDFLIIAFWPLALIVFVAHFFVRKSLKVELGLCARHRKQRQVFMGISLLGVIVVVLSLMAAIRFGSGWSGVLAAAGVLLLYSVAGRYVGVQAISLRRLDGEDAWLGGTAKAFRESLPELPG